MIASRNEKVGTPGKVIKGIWFARLAWMVALLSLEATGASALPHPWVLGKAFATVAISFCVALIVFGRGRLRPDDESVLPINRGWTTLHVSLICIFCGTGYLLNRLGAPNHEILLAAWYGSMLLLPVSMAGGLFGIRPLVRLLAQLRSAWALAALCGMLTVLGRGAMIAAWDAPTSSFGHVIQTSTFRGVTLLLGLFRSDLLSDPATSVIGTQNFTVQIAGRCSGIEGIALMFCLTVGWIVYSRRELRLWRAWMLVPIALVLIWSLNMVRIASLIAIGDAGYPEVADNGFHSEAGWIMFSLIALAFLFLVNGLKWFSRSGVALVDNENARPSAKDRLLAADNVAAVYLLPLLAILAAGFIAGAASAGFEWLYGLRLLAAGGVLYLYRREYRRMDWHFEWLGPVAGVFVFALWILAAFWMERPAGEHAGVAKGLASLGTVQRMVWITLRVVAATVTVPLAEELAFHGYVARRIIAADVETVRYSRLTLVSILGSAAAFGVLHGRMWLAGMAAGVVFGLVAKIRGRLGDAVIAHAIANGLISVWVLTRGDYSLW